MVQGQLFTTPAVSSWHQEKAEKFFLDGMTQAMHNLAVQAHPAAPITIYYAFKQSDTENEGHEQHRLGNLSWMRC